MSTTDETARPEPTLPESLQTVLAAASNWALHLRVTSRQRVLPPEQIMAESFQIDSAVAHVTVEERRNGGATAIPRDRVFSAFGRLMTDLEDYLDEHGKLPPPEAYAALCKTAVAESIKHPLPLIGRERAIADGLMSDLFKRCFGLIEGPYETPRGAYALVQTRSPDNELTGHTFRVETSLNLAIARP